MLSEHLFQQLGGTLDRIFADRGLFLRKIKELVARIELKHISAFLVYNDDEKLGMVLTPTREQAPALEAAAPAVLPGPRP